MDGNYWYHTSPPNRWTAGGSGATTDWFAVDFGVERTVELVKLYFVDDDGRADHVAEGGATVTGDSAPAALRSNVGVRAPAEYRLEHWEDGTWVEIPDQHRDSARPEGGRANTVSFPPLRTTGLRVVLEHQRGSTSGLSEFEAWGPGDPRAGPSVARPPNLAFGATVTASYTSPSARLDEVHDMRIAFTRYTRNGWTAVGSPNARDWIAFDFGEERRVDGVDVYLLGRSGIAAPASFAIEHWDGAAWRVAAERSRQPERPTAWARNLVDLEPVNTERLRVTFEHARSSVTGVAEVVIRVGER